MYNLAYGSKIGDQSEKYDKPFFSAQHLGLHAKLPKGKQNEKSPVFHWKVAILYL